MRWIWLLAMGVWAGGPIWTVLTSGVSARLRGVSVVNERVAWVSGAEGAVLRTVDGGLRWERLRVADGLDFRDVDAMDERTAYALSIGAGEASRIYKTVDGGAHWALQFRNPDPKAFYDAMSFWSERRGLAVSDSVDGRFVVLATGDGGAHWERVAGERLPAALAGEGAYAASGSNIAVWGERHAWIGTSAGRVLRTADGGKTWAVAGTGMASSASAGIFSVAFRDARHGVAVGGDYKLEDRAVDNAAVTEDGGATWRLVKGLGGFRSAVTWLPGGGGWLAVGPSGADLSRDGGRTWAAVAGPGFHAFSAGRGTRVGFGVGERGLIGRLGW